MRHDDELTMRVRALLLDPEPVTLAAMLYGPTWRGDSVAEVDGGHWKTRRFPPPHRAAALLEEALAGLAAHDGRSTRAGRGSGWWLLDPASGSWQASDVEGVAALLVSRVDAVTRSAMESVESDGSALRRCEPRSTRAESTRERLRGSRLRQTLLGAFSALVASGAQGGFGAVAAALRSRLVLTDNDLGALVAEWLRNAVEIEGWEPGDRVTPPELREVFEEDGGTLPPHLLRRGLVAVLGKPAKSNGLRFWLLPASLFEEDCDDGEDDETTEVAV